MARKVRPLFRGGWAAGAAEALHPSADAGDPKLAEEGEGCDRGVDHLPTAEEGIDRRVQRPARIASASAFDIPEDAHQRDGQEEDGGYRPLHGTSRLGPEAIATVKRADGEADQQYDEG